MRNSISVGIAGEAPIRNAALFRSLVGKNIKIQELSQQDLEAGTKVDVLVSRNFVQTSAWPHLKLLQIPTSGTETVDFTAVPEHITICNAVGHAPAMAEYNVYALLSLLRGFHREEKKFRSHPELLLKRENWAFTRELRECDVGILGAGDVARETALLLEGFGATVRVCSRNQPSVAIRGAQWYGATELRDFYKNLDALVIACPLTQLTKSSVGMSQFALMRNGIIVNSARAEILELLDLEKALESGMLFGAALDVWKDSFAGIGPFQHFPNVVATPHISAWTHLMLQRRWSQIAQNVTRISDGLAPSNIVRASANGCRVNVKLS